jgi:hypothetical protein
MVEIAVLGTGRNDARNELDERSDNFSVRKGEYVHLGTVWCYNVLKTASALGSS